MADDLALRRAIYDFGNRLDDAFVDEVRRETWGTVRLTPSLPLIWNASWIAVEQTGMALGAVVRLADDALGGAGLAHRTVLVVDEVDGVRLAAAAETLPGWEAERLRYMAWSDEADGATEEGAAVAAAIEVRQAEILDLRRRIGAENMPPGSLEPARTIEELLELNRRLGTVGGDRWFVAPAAAPASCCRLLGDGGPICQVEEVATLAGQRGRGLAKAVVRAAIAAARASGAETIFLITDAADWPQFLYAKLGFVPAGDLHVLRRPPSP